MNKETYVLILGSGEEAEAFATRHHEARADRYRLLGYFSTNGHQRTSGSNSLPHLGNAQVFKDYIFRNPVDMIVNLEPLLLHQSKQLLEPALEIGLSVAVPKHVPLNLGTPILQKAVVKSQDVLGTTMTVVSTLAHGKAYIVTKRFLDLLLAGSLLIILAPLFLLIAVAVKLSSPKDSIFYHWRVLGKNAKPFVGYKFRTMVPNADQLKQQLLPFNEMQGPVFKMRNDPRITPIGHFLRNFSLDELPQL